MLIFVPTFVLIVLDNGELVVKLGTDVSSILLFFKLLRMFIITQYIHINIINTKKVLKKNFV